MEILLLNRGYQYFTGVSFFLDTIIPFFHDIQTCQLRPRLRGMNNQSNDYMRSHSNASDKQPGMISEDQIEKQSENWN